MSTPSEAGQASMVRRAFLDALPLVLGYIPFGLVLGVTIGASGVPDLAGWASSPLIFAGASQLALVELLDEGAAVAVVIATALVINLRHVMYSGAMSPWFRDAPARSQWLAPLFLADPVYSLAVVRFPTLPDGGARRRYYFTLGVTLWLAWQSLTALGLLVGARLPAASSLTIAVPLVFLALLVPLLEDRPTIAAAVVGGGVTIAAQGLPLHLGLIVGAISGVVAGLLLDREP